MTEYELYHFGIKGMKWGVRRYQNKDGSLTPAGRKRYEDFSSGVKSKSKHRLRLEASYRKLGMSETEAWAAADKRIRTEKILATCAAVTVGTCVAMVANKELRKRIDGVIKAGEGMQRIEMQDTNGKLHDVFYASKGKHDSKRYENLLGFTRQSQAGQAYVMKLEAAADVKVSSQHKAAKLFGDLYKNDDSFRSSVKDMVENNFHGSNRVGNINDLSDKNIKKMYENFNCNLIDCRTKASRPDNVFYNKLKSAGYGAVQDINDMKYSGYRAKNPLIVFDNSGSKIRVKSTEKITENLMDKGIGELRKIRKEAETEKMVEEMLVRGAVLTTGATAYVYISDPYTAETNKQH